MPSSLSLFSEVDKWNQRVSPKEQEDVFPDFLPPPGYDDWMELYFTVDGINYSLEKVVLFRVSNLRNSYRYRCPDFSEFFGEAETLVEAIKDWQRKFHEQYQSIRGLMDYELNEAQRELRKHFAEYISKRNYNDCNPLKGLEMGKLVDICEESNKTEYLIEWINTIQEHVPQKYFGANVGSLQCGNWFEANIKRNYYSNQIVEISDLRIIDNIDELPDKFEVF